MIRLYFYAINFDELIPDGHTVQIVSKVIDVINAVTLPEAKTQTNELWL